MTTQAEEWADRLTERLAELADEAPDHVGPGLWERGKRYRRLRRGGTVLIAAAACLMLVLLGTVVEWRDADPVPVPADAPVGLPDRIFAPSPWLPGTDDAGPLGQLVAVRHSDRGGWSGMRPGVVGISATTGEYRFLDLPGQADVTSFALAPDGRHLAYWTIKEGVPEADNDLVAGLAVLDTVSGDVVRHPLESEHGFRSQDLMWISADTLVFSVSRVVGGQWGSSLTRAEGLRAWSPASDPGGGSRVVPGVAVMDSLDLSFSNGSGQLLVPGNRGRYRVVTPEEGPGDTLVVRRARFPLVDPTGGRVAAIHQGGSITPNRITVGPLSPSASGPPRTDTRTADVRPVPGTRGTFTILRWTDAEHVAVLRRNGGTGYAASLYEIDVTSGEARRLSWLDDSTSGGDIQFATDLLTAPIVEAQAPPRPLDPRWVTVVAGLCAVSGVGGIIRWRRRVQP